MENIHLFQTTHKLYISMKSLYVNALIFSIPSYKDTFSVNKTTIFLSDIEICYFHNLLDDYINSITHTVFILSIRKKSNVDCGSVGPRNVNSGRNSAKQSSQCSKYSIHVALHSVVSLPDLR